MGDAEHCQDEHPHDKHLYDFEGTIFKCIGRPDVGSKT